MVGELVDVLLISFCVVNVVVLVSEDECRVGDALVDLADKFDEIDPLFVSSIELMCVVFDGAWFGISV